MKMNLVSLPKPKIPVTGSCRKTPEFPGTGSSIPTGICPDFFRWIPVHFLCVPTGTGRKSSEKVRKISGPNWPVLIDLG